VDPNYSNAYYAIALLYQAQNNVADAVTSFEKYLALEPAGTYGDNVRSSLDKIRQATGQGPTDASANSQQAPPATVPNGSANSASGSNPL
jgi:tetratricopeptide (TPR) repeat protein